MITDNQSEHSVFVLSPPETLNSCNKVLFLNSSYTTSSCGSVSLYNVEEVYDYAVENLLNVVSDKNTVPAKIVDKTRVKNEIEAFQYSKPYITDGFDTIICISDANEILGYIKYLEPQGTRPRVMNIMIELRPSMKNEVSKLDISYEIEGLITDDNERDKYKDYLNISEARERIQRGDNQYSNRVSTGENMFLGDVSVVSGEKAIKLDLCYGEKINPYPDTDFDNFSIGYVAGGDLALYSWTSDTYSVVSLYSKDFYGNPKSYIKTKEGRAFVPKYFTESGQQRETRIEYISGRYIACRVSGIGTKLYDSYLGEWLDGNTLISDPYSVTNKIYELASNRVHYSSLAKLVPAVSRAYIIEKERRSFLSLFRVIGNWVAFKVDGYNDRVLVCGPSLRVYMTISEFNNLMILNDYALILKEESGHIVRVMSGMFKTYVTPDYKNLYPNTKFDGQTIEEFPDPIVVYNIANSSLKFYKRIAGNPRISTVLTTFAGLIFYRDSENRLYYL